MSVAVIKVLLIFATRRFTLKHSCNTTSIHFNVNYNSESFGTYNNNLHVT